MKYLTQTPSQINCCISYRVNDGDYELVLGQDQGFPEDPINVAEDLTKAPNQSSEVSDTRAPNPTQEGKLRCIPQYFKLLQFH
jgi:hypothetical protein